MCHSLKAHAGIDDPLSVAEAETALRVMCSELAHCEATQRQAREWDGAAMARLEAQLKRLVEVRCCLAAELGKVESCCLQGRAAAQQGPCRHSAPGGAACWLGAGTLLAGRVLGRYRQDDIETTSLLNLTVWTLHPLCSWWRVCAVAGVSRELPRQQCLQEKQRGTLPLGVKLESGNAKAESPELCKQNSCTAQAASSAGLAVK